MPNAATSGGASLRIERKNKYWKITSCIAEAAANRLRFKKKKLRIQMNKKESNLTTARQFCRIKQADVQIKISFVSMLVKLYLK